MAEGRRDEGFTLVEIIVALGIFLVVTMALLPQMVASIRSVSVADQETVIKGLLQQEADRMRGLPFQVARDPDADADLNLLRVYYPSTGQPGSSIQCDGTDGYRMDLDAWAGFVPLASTKRCPYEPTTGGFYRTVAEDVPAGRLGMVTIVRDVQFLSGGTTTNPTPAVAVPGTGYVNADGTIGAAPSSQVGVTLTVLFKDRGQVKARSLFTQIARRDEAEVLVRSSVDVTAVQVTSTSPTGAAESLAAGVVDLQGEVGDASTASSSLAGVIAKIATGDPASSLLEYGATSPVEAPPSLPTLGIATKDAAGCQPLLCWGVTRVDTDFGGGVVVDDGLPRIGAAGSQVRASITDSGDAALAFDNRVDAPEQATGRLVRLVGGTPGTPTIADPTACPIGAAAGDRVSGSGYLTTSLHDTAGTIRDTAACGSARSAAVGVVPKPAWAPDGVVRVTLSRSYAWCRTTGGTPTSDANLEATVQVSNGAGGYQDPVTVAPGTVVPLTTEIPGHGTLGDFLQDLRADPVVLTHVGDDAVATAPGVRVVTLPTRSLPDDSGPDEDSAVVVTMGAASCSTRSAS